MLEVPAGGRRYRALELLVKQKRMAKTQAVPCVVHMPGVVPLTSSQALNNATLPFGLALANKGFSAVLEDPHLRAGLNVYRGRLTYKAVADGLGLPPEVPLGTFHP